MDVMSSKSINNLDDDEKLKMSQSSGKELKRINKWKELDDELDELQKIFFTFLKRWTENDQNTVQPNVLSTWDVYSDEEPFELDESTYSFNNFLESDSYQNEIHRMQDDQ